MFASYKRDKPEPTAPPPGKPHKRTAAGWENERDRSARTQAAKSRAGRDIAEGFPEIKDPDRKARCAASFERFCKEYFPEAFPLPWSPAHLRAIARIEETARHGGKFAYAMPRGSGKTTLAERAAIWAIVNGHRQFVALIGSSAPAAEQLLESIKSELENNDLLAEDFPEVCYPVRRLEGIAHRCKGQLFDGKRTQIVWTEKMLVLPTIAGSKASGAVIQVAGIEGRIRGMKFQRPDGRNARPDLCIVDDPQTDQTAASPTENAKRESILNGAIQGLAGPKKKIALFMPCTVIEPDDMADRMLNRERNPEWKGERTKMLEALPRKIELWEQYWKIRSDDLRADGDGGIATAFYRTNRAAMDEGAIASWPERFNHDEISAVQNGMNLKLGTPKAFASEYQNEPIRAAAQSALPLASDLAKKVNAHKRGVVPAAATRLTAFVDVQQNALFWAVCAFEDDFTGYVIDYGVLPDQSRDHYRYDSIRKTLKLRYGVEGLEESLRRGLDELAKELLEREWPKDDDSTLQVERMGIDFNWAPSSDVVHKFAREGAFKSVVLPARGFGGTAKRGFNDYKQKKDETRGLYWRRVLTADKPRQRRLYYDSNFFKSFVHARLAVSVGGRGCLSFYKASPDRHQLLAEHLVSEDPVPVTAREQTVVEWQHRPSKPDNHLLDCIAGCHAAASERGACLNELKQPPPRARKRLKLSEIQNRKQAERTNRRG